MRFLLFIVLAVSTGGCIRQLVAKTTTAADPEAANMHRDHAHILFYLDSEDDFYRVAMSVIGDCEERARTKHAMATSRALMQMEAILIGYVDEVIPSIRDGLKKTGAGDAVTSAVLDRFREKMGIPHYEGDIAIPGAEFVDKFICLSTDIHRMTVEAACLESDPRRAEHWGRMAPFRRLPPEAGPVTQPAEPDKGSAAK